MWKLKGCNRCGGDLFIDRDESGWYQQCLQCGRRTDLPAMVEAQQKPPAAQRERVLVGAK